MQYFFTLLLLTFSITFSSAQNENDSLAILDHYDKGKESFFKKNYSDAIIHWKKELYLKKEKYGETHFETSRTYHNIGSALRQQSLNKKSIEYYNKALKIRSKLISFPIDKELAKLTKKTYEQLIDLYNQEGDYDKAIILFEDCLSSLKVTKKDVPELLVHLAQSYEKKEGELIDKSILLYKEAISIFRKDNNTKKVAKTLYDLGNVLESKNDLINAEKAYLESHDILYNTIGEYSIDLFNVSNNLGFLNVQKGAFKEADNYLQEAIEIAKILYEDEPAQYNLALQAYPYDNLGEFYSKKGDSKKELEYYEKALGYFITNFESIKNQLNNTPFESIQFNGLKTDIMVTLSSRSQCLYKLDQKEEALENYEFIDKVIYSLRQDINTTSSNLHWIQKTRETYEAATLLAIELDKKEKAFEFIEKSKSVLLFENLLKAKQINLNTLSVELQQERDEFLEKKQLLENEIIYFPKKQDSLNIKLQILKGELNSFDKKHFEQNLLDANFKEKTLVDFQKYLAKKDAIAIEFFGNTEQLIAAIISSSDIQYHIYKKGEKRKANISKWIKNISTQKSNISKSDIQSLNTLSFSIYQDIIQPLNIPGNKSLIIIPDGILQFIPFEALITENSTNTDFSSAAYFIQKNSISYAYSASVHLELSNKRIIGNENILIIAPQSFEGLADLSAEEANTIKGLFPESQILINEDATSKTFLKDAAEYDIIHLSTHASGGSKEFPQPWIAFKDRKLNLSELYNLQLNTQLVTLSACETAKGEMIEGEGVMSLARGFSFAGVPQVITSLWEVNENSTSEMMQTFYSQIKNGKEPSTALHQTKLDYIQNHSLAEASPYHWAAFTAWGHDSYNSKSSGTNLWLYVVFVVLGLLSTYLFMSRKGK
ncbi:MAG: CHAT domain-containing protein/Tfp pilus assembly protein PilF [Maribacter sp.]|jgi:CHAT domain-containing protein/Tfp pilus assembly protein PilF